MPLNRRYDYTRNMKKLFGDYVSQLKSYYCREDFEDLLNEYAEADEDRRIFVLARLKKQCGIRGINTEALLSDRTLLEQIPDRQEMQDALLDFFYGLYKKSLPPSAYMERIVRRLAPQYAGDTVRTAILKKFAEGSDATGKVGSYKIKPLLDKAETLLSTNERKKLPSLEEKDKKALIISKIDDSFFDQKKVTLTDKDLFLVIVQCTDKYRQDASLHFPGISVSAETEAQLKEFCRIYDLDPEGSVFDQLLIICDALDNGALEKDDRFAALTKSLDKDFRSQLSGIKYVNSKEETCRLSEKYKQARKDRLDKLIVQAKHNMPDPALLTLCDDLAKGNFRGNGMTRVHLYYFAIMFGMELSAGEDEVKVDQERDIEKNLFQDYYNDNLIRFLSGDYSDSNAAVSLENEPTGEGINYKSYVESIYLYYLCRKDPDMTPGERINKAEKAIAKCVREAKKRNKVSGDGNKISIDAEDRNTIYFKKDLFARLLETKPDKVVDFILNNDYRIISSDNPNGARIMSDSDERAAYDKIIEILDKEEQLPENPFMPWSDYNEVDMEEKKYVLFQMDRGFDWKVKKLLEEKFASDENFMKLVKELDDRAHVDRGRFKKSMRIQILALLRELAAASDSEGMTKEKLAEKVSREVPLIDRQFSDALEILENMGFDIRKENNRYRLGNRTYKDVMLNDLLTAACRYQNSNSENADNALDAEAVLMQTMEVRLKQNKRITRCEMISFFLNSYITEIEDNGSTDIQEDFPGLFMDFAENINPYLGEARYQLLSEKNIYDMYIVTALYYYMLEFGADN